MYPTNATIYKATYKELTGRILHLHFVAVVAYMNERMNVCASQTGRWIETLCSQHIHSFACPFICYQTCEHVRDWKRMNLFWCKLVLSGPRGKSVKQSTLRVRGSKVKVIRGRRYRFGGLVEASFLTPLVLVQCGFLVYVYVSIGPIKESIFCRAFYA